MTIYEILVSLGYKLKDRGNYWQTSALFRDGDNQTALKIYKDTGVWIDFAHGDGVSKPFKALVKATTGTEELSQYQLEQIRYERRDFLSDEKIYKDDCLGRLLPDYDFFLHKESNAPISIATQKVYETGLATNGKFYNRMVFPIRNKDQRIHGFSARDVLGRSEIKWIHRGKTAGWFYPYYNLSECRESINSKSEIILLESIGDSMACYQAGCENNIVSFTNNISPKLLARISALNVDRIVIGANNDKNKALNKNGGLKGGINTFLKLYQLIDFNKLWFMPPKDFVDFGEMNSELIKNHFNIEYNNLNHKEQISYLLGLTKNIKPMKSLLPVLHRLEEEYKFNYD